MAYIFKINNINFVSILAKWTSVMTEAVFFLVTAILYEFDEYWELFLESRVLYPLNRAIEAKIKCLPAKHKF